MARRFRGTRSLIRRFDTCAEAGFDRLRGRPAADHVFYAASELGDFSLAWVILGCIRGLRPGERHERAALRLGGALVAESFMVNAVIKSMFRRTRPPWDVHRPRGLRRPLTSSFPSGHATSSFTAAVLLSEDDPLWPLYWGVAALIAGSRVYVKIHHASDVAAGVAVGVAMGLTIRSLVPLPQTPTEAPAVGATTEAATRTS
ncbi:MAG TPA: phosphatase PAP2 family protein [Acidimicrobiales bacterium]|nr:phosphatase PAP2 family protein [Acidimicrobiales bacterium]